MATNERAPTTTATSATATIPAAYAGSRAGRIKNLLKRFGQAPRARQLSRQARYRTERHRRMRLSADDGRRENHHETAKAIGTSRANFSLTRMRYRWPRSGPLQHQNPAPENARRTLPQRTVVPLPSS